MTHTRRRFLQLGAAAGAATLLPRRRSVRAQPRPDQKFLFVIGAAGGGSLIDSFLPVLDAECREAGGDADSLICYPEALVAQPPGSNLRCVRNLGNAGIVGDLFDFDYELSDFLAAHARDTALVTCEVTSVNHVIAQERSITGAGIDGGRTIQEAVAMAQGEGLLLPNVNMAAGGFANPGQQAIEARFRSEIAVDPQLFSLATHGSRGVRGAPSADVIDRARRARGALEEASPFGARYAASPLRQRLLDLQGALGDLEAEDLITKLTLLASGELGEGMAQSPDYEALLGVFPGLGDDQLQTQAALAFLLAKYGVSAAISFGPSFAPNILESGEIADTPIAFDFSHTDHLNAQNTMWARIMFAADGLIRLLKTVPHGEGSLWDQSLIYVATDFGRSKTRPARSTGGFSSGHDLNNGAVVISPMVRGNRVYGGVDPSTLRTYGFDRDSGEPLPLTWAGELPPGDAVMREGDVYTLIAQAMDVDFSPGRKHMDALLRS